MVANLTLFILSFGMPKMKGFVESQGLAGRGVRCVFIMASRAKNRSGLISIGSHLPVAFDAVVMVDIHHLVPAGILEALEFGGLAVNTGYRLFNGTRNDFEVLS